MEGQVNNTNLINAGEGGERGNVFRLLSYKTLLRLKGVVFPKNCKMVLPCNFAGGH